MNVLRTALLMPIMLIAGVALTMVLALVVYIHVIVTIGDAIIYGELAAEDPNGDPAQAKK